MERKIEFRSFLFVLTMLTLFVFNSCKEEPEIGPNGSQQGETTELSAPSNVKAKVQGNTIVCTWNSVVGADSYEVYVNRGHWGTSGFAKESTVRTTRFVDEPVYTSNYYYKIKAVAENGEKSDFSSVAFCYFPNGKPTGGDEPSGDEDNPNEDEEPDDEVTRPDAPTGVIAENWGNAILPEIRISWNPVKGATGYRVYRSRYANSSYTFHGETAVTYISDTKPNKGENYYKVTAYNSAGESEYSSYAVYDYDPSSSVAPCPVEYTNCSVSGYNMTLRWRVSSSAGCGVPETAYLRVLEPLTREYIDLRTLDGNTTSVTFNLPDL